jgi:hypothetical protein
MCCLESSSTQTATGLSDCCGFLLEDMHVISISLYIDQRHISD